MKNAERIKHEQNYVEFLEKRIASSNFKANVSAVEYETTQAKLKKAKLVLRVLQK